MTDNQSEQCRAGNGNSDTAPKHGGLWTWVKRIALIAVPIFAFVAVLELYNILTESAAVYDVMADHDYSLYLLLPTIVNVATLHGPSIQALWIVLAIAAVAAAAAVVWHSCRSYRAAEGTAEERIRRTPLYWTAMSFSASMLCVFLIAWIQYLIGLDASSPVDGMEYLDGTWGEDNLYLLFAYTFAGVWEEVVARIIPIGIPMTVVALLCRRKGWWKYLVGGFGMSKLAIVLIVIASLMFGFAHMKNWGITNVAPTFVWGLFFAYLYVRFGVHASILHHAVYDCFTLTLDMNPGFLAVESVLIFLGIFCLAVFLQRLRRFLPRARGIPNWVPPEEESVFSRSAGSKELRKNRWPRDLLRRAASPGAGGTRRPIRRTWTR